MAYILYTFIVWFEVFHQSEIDLNPSKIAGLAEKEQVFGLKWNEMKH